MGACARLGRAGCFAHLVGASETHSGKGIDDVADGVARCGCAAIRLPFARVPRRAAPHQRRLLLVIVTKRPVNVVPQRDVGRRQRGGFRRPVLGQAGRPPCAPPSWGERRRDMCVRQGFHNHGSREIRSSSRLLVAHPGAARKRPKARLEGAQRRQQRVADMRALHSACRRARAFRTRHRFPLPGPVAATPASRGGGRYPGTGWHTLLPSQYALRALAPTCAP